MPSPFGSNFPSPNKLLNHVRGCHPGDSRVVIGRGQISASRDRQFTLGKLLFIALRVLVAIVFTLEKYSEAKALSTRMR